MTISLDKVKEVIERYRDQKGALIPMLQDVQEVYGYVPEETVELISKEFNIFPVEIFGILTFYSQFNLEPRGKYIVRVCQGTACHVMGGRDILEYLSDRLGIGDGETTEDKVFSLERVACLGCCGIAPVVAVNQEFYGDLTIEKLDGLIETYRERDRN
ncbi:NADH-quinone oxidoreductase subunit NuoE [Spirochaetota bacterium]